MSKIPDFFRAIRQGPYVHVSLWGNVLGLFDPEDGETQALAKQLRALADELDPPLSGGDPSNLKPLALPGATL